jgi:amino acid adenylation domain-containing protein
VAGEIFLGGAGVTRGYLGRPDLTAAAFVPDPWGPPGSRLYRTGDRARYSIPGEPDGGLEFLGRIDQQIKLRGFRIEPGEIEAVLAGHPEVRECAVVARRGPRGAAGEMRLVAYVVGAPRVAELRSWLQGRLPEHMVPAAFVVLEALSLTVNGKVDRKALPEPGQTGIAPGVPGAETGDVYAGPSSPVEELLAGIWSDLLGVERIGVHDDFFTLGGHSLLATQVASRIRGVLGVELPLRQLFEAPTIAGLARAVHAAQKAVSDGEGRQAPPVLPVPRDAREGDLPLSFGQQRLWFLDRLEPGNAAYNIPSAVRLAGEVSADLLGRIFAEVVRRHEVLRTTFRLRDGKPVQVIASPHPPGPPLPLIDLSHLPEPEREAHARVLALEEARRPFDLQRGPLLRLGLVRLGARDHLLLMTMHHIVSDGWSTGVLLRELGILHQAFSQHRPSPLPELPVQYADFAVWQRTWLQGEVLAAQLAFWKRQLDGAPRVLDLPLDRPRPAEQTFRGATLSLTLPQPLSAAVHGLCRRERATPFMVLLAAWGLLLGRHASQGGQDDVLLGTPIAGRNRQETEGLIGFFVNTLAMRVDLRSDEGTEPGFAKLLGRVRQVALDGYNHQDVPFEHLVEDLVAERDLAVSPLFQVMFVLQNAQSGAGGARLAPGLTLTPLSVDSGVAKLDLTLTLGEGEDGSFTGALEYNTGLFDGGTAERLWDRFQVLLQAAAGAPDTSVADLPLLTPAEQRQLGEWNDTGAAPAADLCLHELFAAQAERTPGAVCLVHGARRLTYAELAARAGGFALRLRGLLGSPEARVAVCLERSPDLIAALLGVLAAGGAYVPIDPAYPLERRRLMLEDSGAAVLVTRGRLSEDLMGGVAGAVQVLDLESPHPPNPPLPPPHPPLPGRGDGGEGRWAEASPDHLAYVIYTSGSTGRPKGVAIEHRSAVALMLWAREEFSADELSGLLAATSVCFDLSVFEIFAPLSWGGRVILAENALELPTLPAAGEVRVLNTVPSAAAELVRLGLPSSVRTVGLAGEPLPAALAASLYATGTVERVLNLYGPSEDTTYSTGALVPRPDQNRDGRAPAIGRPLPGTRAHVVDLRGASVPPGVAGELWLAGAGLARGYLGRPELTAERFTPDPAAAAWGNPGGRVYRTGDLVRHRPDGELELLGRIDHQVKVRGFRIELGEIEAALRSHPAVREGAVLVREDLRENGPGARLLVAYVVPEVDRAELRAWLGVKLPEYMVPSVFVFLDGLPLTVNGKVDRRALPAPGKSREPESGHLAPRDALELRLVRLWEELLGIEPVGVRDDFFALGGHSLLAVQLMARLQAMLGASLPVAALLRNPTVERLAALLREGVAPTREALVALTPNRVPGTGGRPLFLVHPIGGEVLSYVHLARHLAADRPVYGLQVPDSDGRTPWTTVEEMAAGYLRSVREVQPAGPYSLGGWSMGGVVAFEMARQLERAGEIVDPLVLIDSYAPGAQEGNGPMSEGDLVALFAYDLARLFGTSSFALPPDFGQRTAADALGWLAAEAARLGLLPPGLDDGELARRFAVFEANFRALEIYEGGACAASILLFRAASTAAPDRGWERLIQRPIEAHDLPGDHYSLLQPDRVQPLATFLRQRLANVAVQEPISV